MTAVFQTIGIVLCSVLVAISPWPLGGNLPFVRTLLGIATVVLLVLTIGLQIRDPQRSPLSKSWLFLLLGLVYAVFQVTPFSRPLATPMETEAVQEVLDAESLGFDSFAWLNDHRTSLASRSALSVYPAATRERLADLGFAVGIFLTASCLLTRSKAAFSVMLTATLTGIVFAFFAIVQKLTWNGKIAWFYEYTVGGTPFGTFVNRNNAGGYILICLGAAVYFVALQYFKWNPRKAPASNLQLDWSEADDSSNRTWYLKILGFVAAIQPRHLYSCAAITFLVVGILLSLSRGAMIGLATIIFVAMILLSRTNRLALLGIGLVGALGIGFLVWLEQSDSVLGRIETLANLSEAGAPRFQHWFDALPYVWTHGLWGTGLGTYKFVQLQYQKDFLESTFSYAENVYLETLGELGIVGLVALLGFIGSLFYACGVLLNRQTATDRALGVAGLCCLAAQCAISFFDFGVYLPANAITLAVIMGSVAGRAATTELDRVSQLNTASANSINSPAKWRLIALVVVGLVCCWSIRESVGVESVRQARSNLKSYKKSLGEDQPRLDEMLGALRRARAIRPDDAAVDFLLGEYEVARYRQLTTDRVIALAAEATQDNLEAGELSSDSTILGGHEKTDVWINTSLTSLHRIYRFAERNNPELLQEFEENPYRDHLRRAWDHYLDSDQKCQLLSETQFRLAQLSIFFDPDQELKHLVLALTRTAPNTELLFEAGLLALHSGKQALAVNLWRQCLNYSDRFEAEIVESGIYELPMKLLFESVFPQDPERLFQISSKYFYEGKKTLPNDLLLIHTKRLLQTAENFPNDRRLYLNAEIERKLENFDKAVEFYRLALSVNPDDVRCRLNYATCLFKIGDLDEAVVQLKKCELYSGDHLPTVRRLLSQIREKRLAQTR